MPSRLITLVIEGLPAEQSRIVLSDFLKELGLFLRVLKETDRQITSEREPTTYYRIVDLRHSSPATIVVEAVPRDAQQVDVSERVVSELFAILTSIRRQGAPEHPVSTSLLSGIRDMTALVGHGLHHLQLESNGDSVAMDSAFRGQVAELLGRAGTCPGAVRGMLEAINVHREANVFPMYPDVGPAKITCHFPVHLPVVSRTAAVA
jgi:hypothetical protein